MIYDITIIIPVYNASKYLNDTINSLVNQTIFEKLEIVLVNDGSTDESEKICKEYSDKYSNIKLINQENLGVSAARNTGLSNVTGKYVTFLDSDDIVSNNLYEKEINAITNSNYDILITDFVKKHEDGTIKKYRNCFQKKWNNSNDALIDFFKGVIGSQVVDKLFLYTTVQNIKFPSNYKIGEDMWFVYKAIRNSKEIFMDTNICGYQYIVRESSAMTGRFTKKYFDPIKLSKLMHDECEDKELLREYSESHLIHEACKVLEYIYRHNAQKSCDKQVKCINELIQNYSIISAYKFLIRKQFFGFILMRMSPRLYLLIHKIMHIG